MDMNASYPCDQSFSKKYEPLFDDQIQSLRNNSIFNNSESHLIKYVCDYIKFQQVVDTLAWVIGLFYSISSGAGLIGNVLIFRTIYKNEHFNAPCFVVYRVMSVLELVYTPFKVIHAYAWMHLNGIRYSYSWTWAFYVLARTLGNVAAQTVESLALFLSAERALGTLLPTKFHLFDRRKVYYGGFCVAVTIAIVLWVPKFIARTVKMNNDSTYSVALTGMGETSGYKVYEKVGEYFSIGQGIMMLLTTSLAAIGTLKTWRNRARLLRKGAAQAAQPNANAMNVSKKRWRRSVTARAWKQGEKKNENAAAINSALQLCFLQVCVSTPIAMNTIFLQLLSFYPMLDKDGVVDIGSGYRYWYIRFGANALDAIAHGFDFYLYLVFSITFRENFLNLFHKVSELHSN